MRIGSIFRVLGGVTAITTPSLTMYAPPREDGLATRVQDIALPQLISAYNPFEDICFNPEFNPSIQNENIDLSFLPPECPPLTHREQFFNTDPNFYEPISSDLCQDKSRPISPEEKLLFDTLATSSLSQKRNFFCSLPEVEWKHEFVDSNSGHISHISYDDVQESLQHATQALIVRGRNPDTGQIFISTCLCDILQQQGWETWLRKSCEDNLAFKMNIMTRATYPGKNALLLTDPYCLGNEATLMTAEDIQALQPLNWKNVLKAMLSSRLNQTLLITNTILFIYMWKKSYSASRSPHTSCSRA